MAKTNERKAARELFMQGNTQKKIAEILGLQEKTVGVWVEKFKWRQERDARMGSVESRVNNIKELISSLSEERLEIQRKIQKLKGSDLPKGDKTVALSQMMNEASKLDDGVSKWNKTLENLDKKNKVSLSLYIHVMERVMKAIEKKHPNIFSQLIDFQEEHLTEIAEQLS